ncbi:hypothetical protein HGA88_07080 [Candidatus Roizmanbacteria bacterium]|nr:hypothetical protein [Candidatus Roizmanbacteria bacterium]
MTQEIYGTTPATIRTYNWRNREEWSYNQFNPTQQLEIKLRQLEKDSIVAIEHSLEKLRKRDCYDQDGFDYWRKIGTICSQQNLQVVYLEDPRDIQEVERVQKDYKRAKDPLQQYRAQTYLAYLEGIIIPDHVRAQLIAVKPAVAILRNNTALGVSTHPDELQENGLKTWYTKETVEGNFNQNLKILSNPKRKLYSEHMQYLEGLRRKMRALDDECIIPGGQPFARGSWSPELYPKGLFEMYIRTGKEFAGLIEDTSGTAYFKGELRGCKISFEKNYIPHQSTTQAGKGTIYYEGTLDDNSGLCVGTYTIPDDDRAPGITEPFVLELCHYPS